jgi:hypothetical protein
MLKDRFVSFAALLGTGFLLLLSLSSSSSCSRGIKGDMAKSTECSKSYFKWWERLKK